MKVIYEISDSEDSSDFLRMIHHNALKYHSALWEIQEHIRYILKYSEVSEETEKELGKIREIIPDLGE